MHLTINGQRRPLDEVTVSISYEPKYSLKRRVIAVMETWDIRGRVIIQDPSQPSMTAALQRLDRDFAQHRPNLVFTEDNSSNPTFLKLLAADCIDGPTLVGSGLPSDSADIYATGMSYNIGFTALKPIAAAGSDVLLSFTESLTNVEPGGLRIGYVGGALNYAEAQIFKQRAPYEYSQSGSAVGLYGYPNPPPAIFPQFQVEEMKPGYVSPRNHGWRNTEYETRWSYRFISPFKLTGFPHEL